MISSEIVNTHHFTEHQYKDDFFVILQVRIFIKNENIAKI